MNDLFGEPTPTTRNPRKPMHAWVGVPIVNPRTGAVPQLGGGTTQSGAGVDYAPKHRAHPRTQDQDKAARISSLQKEKAALLERLAEASAETVRAEAAAAPYEAAFQSAHDRLVQLTANRRAGARYPKDEVLAAYDARMLAGHAWHPHRNRFQEAKRWKAAIVTELQNINAALG